MNYARIKYLRNAAYIKRFHTVPAIGESQTVSAHSWGVATLLNELFEDSSKELILAALYHDVAETLLGDMPATSKWTYPELAAAMQRAEEKAEATIGIEFALTGEEYMRLKLCDMLELIMFSAEQVKLGNHYFHSVYRNGTTYLKQKYSRSPDYHKILDVLQFYSAVLQTVEPL